MKAKEWFTDFAKGTSLGTGILPGVSVGTVGIIVNIYDKLLSSIDGLRKKETFLKSLLALIPIGTGCLAATFVILLFWQKLAEPNFPFVIVAALAGFVIGALPILLAELKGKWISVGDALRILGGFVFASGIGICAYLAAAGIIRLDLDFTDEVDNPFANPWIFGLVFLVGFFSAVSCIVPGISGAMVLFIFGLYNPIINLFFSTKKDGEITHHSIFSDPSKLGPGLLIIAVLLVGMLIGFLITSKFMKDLLAKHRRGTFGVVIGFVLGSIVSMFFNNDMYWVYIYTTNVAPYQYALGAVLGVLVCVGTFFLVRYAQKKNAQKSPEQIETNPADGNQNPQNLAD